MAGRTLGLAAILGATVVIGGGPAAAQRDFENPPVLMDRAKPDLTNRLPGAVKERQLDLFIRYTNSTIFNPQSGREDAVRLRSYVGTDVDPKTPFVAPTIEAAPGDTVRITLHNVLDPKDPSCPGGDDINVPHCYNTTNLHSHGLWVSPTGNSDNVLLSIPPETSFQYEYNIPADHPSGTFWYHPHRHGSTALQVSSGMAGALIVRGDRKPTLEVNGDLDTLLVRPAPGAAAPNAVVPLREDVMVFQQITYYCKYGPDRQPIQVNGKTDWRCDPGDVGIIESYDQMGPGDWASSGRYTSVNGLVLPTFKSIQAGQTVRWRLVHAGIRDTINFRIQGLVGDGKTVPSKPGATTQCAGPVIPHQVVAADGLTMDRAQEKEVSTLQPGYRNDLLVMFPKPGVYCIVDATGSDAGSVGGAAGDNQIMGFVWVEPGQDVPVAGIRGRIVTELKAMAARTLPKDVAAMVVADLDKDFSLAKYVPHRSISAEEVQGTQKTVFFIDTTTNPVRFQVGQDFKVVEDPPGSGVYKPAGARAYQPDTIDRTLPLGGVQAWELRSYFVSHPFHIHVNPFQIVSIINPNGKDVSEPGAVDDADPADRQYAGLKGVWKDTLWVKSLITSSLTQADIGANGEPKTGVYKITIRTRYQRYIGEFVMHCHILDHEDQGMMENVAVVLTQPDGTAVPTGHGGGHGSAKGANPAKPHGAH